MHVRSSFSLFLSIPRSPLPHCPHHHWATVKVVSGRGMMPNLTGVEPYLYSLHSRFCFKGFVYTRPINHLLPSHSPAAFKVGARLRDNVQHRCQCKSLSSPLKKGNEDSLNSGHFLPSVSSVLFFFFYFACGLDHYLDVAPAATQAVLVTIYSSSVLMVSSFTSAMKSRIADV